MATYYARKTGNINATDVWATTPAGTAGAVTFAAGDVLVANSFTVTVNVSTDLGSTGEVRNDTTGGATGGGTFLLSNGVTLTANVFAGAASSACCTLAVNTSNSATIVGTLRGGTGSANNFAVNHNSAGTLSVVGSLFGGTGNYSEAIRVNFTGPLIITGNVTGGADNTPGINVLGNSPVTITGNVTGGSVGAGVSNSSAQTVVVTGNATGGTGSSAAGAQQVSGSGTTTIVGSATGGTGAGAANSAGGTLTVARARGGPLVGNGVGVSSASAGITTVDEIEFGDLGASPTSGPIRLRDLTSNAAVLYRFGTTKKTLTDPASTGTLPAASDVRLGTVYASGNRTGTLAMPTAAQVLSGVAVDATTGNALLDSATVQGACDAALAAFSSGRLGNCSTVASTGQQLASALSQ